MAGSSDDIDRRLQEAAAADAQLRTVAAELQSVETELHKARSSEERWRRQAERAADELRALRGFALSALWTRLLGRTRRRVVEHESKVAEARREQEAIDVRTAPLHALREELRRRRVALEPVSAAFAAICW